MKLRVVVVEDEPLAAERLVSLLDEMPGVEVAAVAATGAEAIRRIEACTPDLVFLDVALPDINGFEVLRALRRRPAVVFVTAFDEFAVKAFDERALDYLLKPYSRARLEEAVCRALARFRDSAPVAPPFLVRRRDSAELIPESEVVYFAAEDKYVFLCTERERFFYEATLKELEGRLDGAVFLRIHRRFIVARRRVRRLHRSVWGDLQVELDLEPRTHLPVGRAYRAAVRARFGR